MQKLSSSCSLKSSSSSSSSSFSVFEDGWHQVASSCRRLFFECGTFPIELVQDRERGRGRSGGRTEGVLFAGAVALSLVSCHNDKIEVYKIPKEGIKVAMQSGSAGSVPPLDNAARWSKPDGWSEQPLSEMRLGSFKVDGANAASADVSVIAFPGEAGGLASNINRWRGQLQLGPLDEDQLAALTQRTEVDNVPTCLVDFQTVQNAPKPSRILGAVLQTADRTWFVKMTGPPDLIESQRQKFLDFVKSFRFTNSAGAESAAPAVSAKPKSTNDE
jgi:hypothetical protein